MIMSKSPKSWISKKIEFRISPIAGKGIFAVKKIHKDEIVAVKGGHIIKSPDFFKLDSSLQEASLQISKDFYIGPLFASEIENIMVGVNHSCNPNTGLFGQVETVAMRDIEVGEELVADYCIAYNSSSFEFTCNCKSQNCRNLIKDDDWTNPLLQKKYKGYFSYHIQKMIDK